MSTTVDVATLGVARCEVADGDLLDHLPAPTSSRSLAWVREGEGLVGWGEAARLEVSGPDRFELASRWWQDLAAGWEDARGREDGAVGPVAFGSFAFDDEPGTSVLVVPEVLLTRRDGRTWLTTVGPGDGPARLSSAAEQPAAPRGLRYSSGQVPVTVFRAAVASAVGRIRAGELAKVVLAYDLLASADADIDTRFLLHRLARDYPDCWTFAVDGLVGATPELLVQRSGDQVLSRVLAGTAPRGADAVEDVRRREALRDSAKDVEEHRYAVESVTALLAPHCSDVSVPADPVALELANVWHLASDVTGRLTGTPSALELAGALHPTAAVGGTPTADAARVRAGLEALDRGRYAGPVGWVDTRGDGEWGLALRCAQVDGASARLFAGCGIVADSDPDEEVREADAKFVPMRDALEGAR